MSTSTDRTTLVSLFHTQAQASKTLSDLEAAGIPAQTIGMLSGHNSSELEATLASLARTGVPERDLQVLSAGVKNGGTVVVVCAEHSIASKAEDIFESHHASKIDERELAAEPTSAVASVPQTATTVGDAVIPVVEEELVVGKRKVQSGGVRVFSRIVETPVEENVLLREEHATVTRQAVNRPISEAEVDRLRDQEIEVQNVGEEAVVAKNARVVEEVQVGKQTTEHSQTITDTVRRTEVEVEQVAGDLPTGTKSSK